MSYECTVVTAYYDFPCKKHASNSYHVWIKMFLNNIKSNVLIFTDKDSCAILNEISKDMNNVRIAVLPIT